MTIKDVQKLLRQVLKPLKNKVLLTIGRGVLLAAKDSKSIQQLQISLLADEVKDQVESFAHFGFTSNPPKGSDLVMVSVGGNRDHGIVIATEHRKYRFKDLGEGEAALYSKDGDYVHLKNGNVMDVKTKTLNIEAETVVNITTPEVNISANLNVGADTEITGETIAKKSVTVTENVVATLDVSGANVVGLVSAGAPSVAAATSLTVAGTELKDYQTHDHDYNDEGAPSNPNTTGPVN